VRLGNARAARRRRALVVLAPALLAVGSLATACAGLHLSPPAVAPAPHAAAAPAPHAAAAPAPAEPRNPPQAADVTPPPAPSPAAPEAPDPVAEAEALIARDQVDAALALLKRTLADGTASAEDALYWIAVLSFAPPISNPEQGRAAVDRLLAEYPHGKRRRAAAAMKALLDERDHLASDNAGLKGDLQKLLNIDVEAQRQRRGAATAPVPAAPAPVPAPAPAPTPPAGP
jgi:hypothetical protein